MEVLDDVNDRPMLVRDQSALVVLLCMSRRRRQWYFDEDAESEAASALPTIGGRHLQLLTLPADGDHATGGRVWHSAPALCRWMTKCGVDAQTVCELGAGTGACGIFAAALGAASVLLTDGASELLPLIESNILRNRHLLAGPCATAKLCWGSPQVYDLSGYFDLTLGSDVIYDVTAHSALCVTLRALLTRQRQGSPPPRAVLATMPRQRAPIPHDPMQRYTDAALAHFRDTAAVHQLHVTPLGSSGWVWTATQWCDAPPCHVEVRAMPVSEESNA